MKQIILILSLLASIPSLFGQENSREHVYVYTDKACYISGEDIWFGFQVLDQDMKTSLLSKVGYLEICDMEKPHIQHKVALEQGYGSGKITIPANVSSGMYQLAAYTRYMRNEGEETFFRKKVTIVNVHQPSTPDRMEIVKEPLNTELTVLPQEEIKIRTNQRIYANREQVRLSITGLPGNMISRTISVVRRDSITKDPEPTNWNNFLSSNQTDRSLQAWLPEYEGHIISGRISSAISGSQPADKSLLSSSASFVGEDIRYIQGQILSEGKLVNFYTSGIYGPQEVVLSTTSADGQLYRTDLEAPFARPLPQSLPVLKVYPSPKELMERSIGVQLNTILRVDSLGNEVPLESYYHLQPHLSYDLDEYTRFNTMQETFTEFVRRINVGRIDGKRRIRVLVEGEKRFNTGSTLVLLDGVPLHNHEDIISYNPRLLRKIDIYSGKYTFGGEVFECMVSFVTHRKNLPAIQLSEEYQLFSYDCPSLPVPFEMPDYSDPEAKRSRKPDFRHTLYWNPRVTPDESTELYFYTSDLCGEFKVTIEGIDSKGEVITGSTLFRVE